VNSRPRDPPTLPSCPGCRGQRFWRDTTNGRIGEWTCAKVRPDASVGDVDILGLHKGDARVVCCCTPQEATDRETFAQLLKTLGAPIALAVERIRPVTCEAGSSGGWRTAFDR
jgi:hypothetical protein